MAATLVSPEQEALDRRLARSLWYFGGLMTIHADAAEFWIYQDRARVS